MNPRPDESPISFHLRIEDETPAHVTVGVFCGRRPGSRGKCGSLTFRVEEWPQFLEVMREGTDGRGMVLDVSRLVKEGSRFATEPLSLDGRPVA